jgi:archaemetzincin
MVSPEAIILISPIGEMDAGLIREIGRYIQQAFGMTTEILPLVTDLEFALDPTRSQYHSTLILDKLASRAPAHGLKILGITDVDLFIPILTYVYGEAQLGGRAAVVSTCRLQEGLDGTDAAFFRRMAKEAVHELGHTFTLRHCPDESCIMHYCRSIHDVDKKEDRLCRYCQILLHDEMVRLGVAGSGQEK